MARKEKAASKYDEPKGSSNHGPHMPATKIEAFQMAIAAGFESPQIGPGYIQSQFGMEVSPHHFNSTKSLLRRRILNGEAVPKPAAEIAAAANGDADLIEALEAMKPPVASLGEKRSRSRLICWGDRGRASGGRGDGGR